MLFAEAAMLWVGIDDMDEGYFVEQATRVLRGDVPYRDFATLYTPGLLYDHAAIFFAMGGPHVIGARLFSLATRMALALGMYALARPLARPFWRLARAVSPDRARSLAHGLGAASGLAKHVSHRRGGWAVRGTADADQRRSDAPTAADCWWVS